MFLAFGQAYVLAYRYLCRSARELHHLWNALEDCAETRDRTAAEFRKGLSSLILDVFAEGRSLQPSVVLPTLPFALKCRFVYAEAAAIERREEMVRFHEDITVRRLAVQSGRGCDCGSPLCNGRNVNMVRLKQLYRNPPQPQKNCARPIPIKQQPTLEPSAKVETAIAEESMDDSSDGGLQYDFGRDELIEGGEVFEMEISPCP